VEFIAALAAELSDVSDSSRLSCSMSWYRKATSAIEISHLTI